jgi:hypothetical protein
LHPPNIRVANASDSKSGLSEAFIGVPLDGPVVVARIFRLPPIARPDLGQVCAVGIFGCLTRVKALPHCGGNTCSIHLKEES